MFSVAGPERKIRSPKDPGGVRRASGKLKYLADSESAMGAFVNDVIPEEAARMLREVRP
jgi:galactose-1-phosphate uridylyltransferase